MSRFRRVVLNTLHFFFLTSKIWCHTIPSCYCIIIICLEGSKKLVPSSCCIDWLILWACACLLPLLVELQSFVKLKKKKKKLMWRPCEKSHIVCCENNLGNQSKQDILSLISSKSLFWIAFLMWRRIILSNSFNIYELNLFSWVPLYSLYVGISYPRACS